MTCMICRERRRSLSVSGLHLTATCSVAVCLEAGARMLGIATGTFAPSSTPPRRCDSKIYQNPTRPRQQQRFGTTRHEGGEKARRIPTSTKPAASDGGERAPRKGARYCCSCCCSTGCPPPPPNRQTPSRRRPKKRTPRRMPDQKNATGAPDSLHRTAIPQGEPSSNRRRRKPEAGRSSRTLGQGGTIIVPLY